MNKVIPPIAPKPLFSADAERAVFLFARLSQGLRRGVLVAFFLILAVGAADSATTRPLLVVGGDHASPPYEFIENGKPTGFDIELMQAVAEVMGFRAEFRLGPWAEVRQGLEEGHIDVLAGMFYSVDRSRVVDFSVPHTLVTPGLFVRTDSSLRSYADIQGREIIVQDKDIMHDFLSRGGLASHIVTVPDTKDVLRLLASGQHDCAVMPSLLQGEHFVHDYGLDNIRAIKMDLPRLRYCFAVRKGELELLSTLDEGLNILKAGGRYQNIYDKWFGLHDRRVLWDRIKIYVFAAVGAVVVLLGASFAWSRSLRRQVRLSTAQWREREAQFRVLTETSPVGICLFQGERIVYVNPAIEHLFGYTASECLQMRFWDWVHDDFRALVKQRGLARQRGDDVPSRYECRHVTKGGAEKWVFVSAGRTAYRGGFAGIVTYVDITDRKRMEEELRDARDELEKRVEERTEKLARATEALRASEKEKSLILNNTDNLLLFYDLDMNIQWANKAAGDSVKLPSHELRNRRCWDLWHRRREPCVGCPVLRARDTGQPHELEIQAPDTRVWHIRAYPVKDETGRLIGMVEFVQDFTERKLAEKKLERQTSRLVELNDTLENRVREEVAKNREKDVLLIQQNRQAAMGELLEHVAHQWKQPLTVVSLIVQNLCFKSANGNLTEDAIREIVDTTTDLLNHMAQTIEDFRDFYRPDKEKTVFRISDSVDNALTLLLPALKHEAITVDVEIEPDLLAVGYPRQYIQVLLNVLSNARDALTQSAVEHPRIRLRGYAENGRAVVNITDNAGGIPEAIVSNIFDLYVTTKEARGGTGIGLHMSKNIIEKNMQGSLSARNTEQGAQFVIAVNMPKADSLKPASSAAR